MSTEENLAQGWKTGHVGLNVSDLQRSLGFYQEVFGFEVVGKSLEAGREFVFLGDGERLVLTLWMQSDGRFNRERPGLHHLSFEVESINRVRETETRARRAGASILHEGIVAHGEGAASGGIFFEDPDGIRLEIYAPTGAESYPAATPGAPSCGFF
jgi:lactoylglutathione lyase